LGAAPLQKGLQAEVRNQFIEPLTALGRRQPGLLQAEEQVLPHREGAEYAGLLGQIAQPHPGALGHGERRDGATVQNNVPLVRLQLTNDQVKGGGLSCPVGSQQANHLPRLQLHVQGLNQLTATQDQADALQLQAHGAGSS